MEIAQIHPSHANPEKECFEASDRIQCEGWVRHGGAFTFGPVTWVQCKNMAAVVLGITQKGVTKEVPACVGCIQECQAAGIQVLAVRSLGDEVVDL